LLLALSVLCGTMLATAAAEASATEQPARVWFLPPSGEAQRAPPMLYANGAAVATISANSDFYRDLAPGTYRFTVQPFGLVHGLPAGHQADIVKLAPGTQTYIEIRRDSGWVTNYPHAGSGYLDHCFVVPTMTPQLARAYLPSLTYVEEN
jgi:hypothetical protein